MIRTFLDSGVLIAAARLRDPDAQRALEFLDDPNRIFLTSPFVHLEVVPKAVFYKKRLEQSFYDKYFKQAAWFKEVDKIEAAAQTEAVKAGLGGMDALHLGGGPPIPRGRVRHDREAQQSDPPVRVGQGHLLVQLV